MDYGHEQADKMLKDLEKKIQKEYSKAAREVEASMNKFLAQYQKNDREMMALWKSGEITKKEYTDWRKKQIILTDKWLNQRDELVSRYMEADKVASGLINDHKMDVYALNYNYGTYEVEKGARLDRLLSVQQRQRGTAHEGQSEAVAAAGQGHIRSNQTRRTETMEPEASAVCDDAGYTAGRKHTEDIQKACGNCK